MRHFLIFLLLLPFALLTPLLVEGQVLQQTPAAGQDTTLAAPDSVALSAPSGDIATTIKYAARDSILFDVEREVVYLYGDAKINYGTMSMEAAYIEIDYETNMLTATTLTDSTGKEVGVPVFTDGGETYAAKRIAYNYKSRRGRISEVVTQQGEGYIHAEVVKRNENNEFFGLHSRYTTCNLEHPHFYIGSQKFKVIPNDKVMSGPFNLVIGDIPTPLGFLFGLFPTPKAQKRSSGIQVPSFGENTRGFYLQDLGYYFAWNDYIGTLVQADIYSLGGYNIDAKTDYVKRYSYRGSFGLQYNFLKNDEADIAYSARSTNENLLPPTQRSIWIDWSHTPVQKPGRGRFSANVRAGTPGHQRVNYNSASNYLAAQFNSSISYQKTIPNSPFSYTINARQSQSNSPQRSRAAGDGSTVPGAGNMSFVLPDLSLSMTTVSIYELFSDAPSTGAWYENFTIGYNVRARNEVSNNIPARSFPGLTNFIGQTRADTTLPISFNNIQELWENGKREANHNLSIGLGNYKVFRFFNFSPSVSYGETWLDEKYTFSFDPDSQKVDIDTTNFGRVYQYAAGASLNTTIYGTAYIKGKRVEAIRHLIRPSISYNYRPDFGDERFGFYQEVMTGIASDNTARVQTLSRFRSGAPGSSMSSAMGFSIDNNIEMKVRSKTDTAATKFEKVTLINNLRLSSGYDFAADSFKLAPIRLTMNTRLFKMVDVTLASAFDPYRISTNDAGVARRVDEYYLDLRRLRLARVTTANLNLRTNLNPAARKTETTSPTNLPALQQDMDPLLPDYIDFKIPWTLALDYTLSYNRSLSNVVDIRQTFGMNGTLGITEMWQVSYNANYDFVNNNIAHANVNIHRDLHCWDMSIGWVPFGIMRGYNITINARSALLRDLKLTKRSRGNALYQ
ncbi:putative LPS assembly protein LptD [Pontibacter diazotrophicus]|uniref:putative LPS assembly protein LptD n=1 Tax=Pontibacter diazotrophicus TaxID=1400979 RepID=UPI0011C06A04|nr:putative LPS assembly protein LptD [Pontibacter diazotrophicus]